MHTRYRTERRDRSCCKCRESRAVAVHAELRLEHQSRPFGWYGYRKCLELDTGIGDSLPALACREGGCPFRAAQCRERVSPRCNELKVLREHALILYWFGSTLASLERRIRSRGVSSFFAAASAQMRSVGSSGWSNQSNNRTMEGSVCVLTNYPTAKCTAVREYGGVGVMK
jgi:hypothetical protein